MQSKWSKEFAADLAERVGSTFLQALLGVLVATQTPALDWSDAKAVWAILGVPTAAALIKGLLANMVQPASGASLLGTPPVKVSERGESALTVALVVLALFLVVILLARLL